MNKDNYVSLAVAQRLVENGIVLETDAVWFHFKGGWQLIRKDGNRLSKECIPSTCFAELWSELAKYKALCYHSNGVTLAVIEGSPSFYNINPADAIAELLIYVKGREKV